MTGREPVGWQEAAADQLAAAGITAAAYVPDSRLDRIVRQLTERQVRVRTLTREEECIGYAAGQVLANKRPVVLMQCSGLGNALNAIASLLVPASLGVPLIVSMRGTLGETNPAQLKIGQATPVLLKAVGVPTFTARLPAEVVPVIAGITEMATAGISAAALLEAELGGQRERN